MSWFRRKHPTFEQPDGSTLTLLTRDPAWWNAPGTRISEDEQASRRWAEYNAEAKTAGCKCGRPGTHVELNRGNRGWVPVEIWTCDEHIGVNVWVSDGSGHFRPA